jgi:hypothetical protein
MQPCSVNGHLYSCVTLMSSQDFISSVEARAVESIGISVT